MLLITAAEKMLELGTKTCLPSYMRMIVSLTLTSSTVPSTLPRQTTSPTTNGRWKMRIMPARKFSMMSLRAKPMPTLIRPSEATRAPAFIPMTPRATNAPKTMMAMEDSREMSRAACSEAPILLRDFLAR